MRSPLKSRPSTGAGDALLLLAAGFILGGVVSWFATPWAAYGVGISCGALASILYFIEHRSVSARE